MPMMPSLPCTVHSALSFATFNTPTRPLGDAVVIAGVRNIKSKYP